MDTASAPAGTLRGSSTANSASHVPAKGSYEAYVLGLVPRWPHLRIVTDFMSSNHKQTPAPFAGIAFKTDIRVIDVTQSYIEYGHGYVATVEAKHFLSVDQLRQFLDQSGSEVGRRFIMVEDLSAEVIEFLGSTFSLDPEFFAQHLSDWWAGRQGLSSSEDSLHQFGSSSRKLGFQHFKFQRAYGWGGTECMEDSRFWQLYLSQGTKPEVLVGEGFSAFNNAYYTSNGRYTGE